MRRSDPDEWVSAPWHGEPKLKFALAVTYADGSSGQIVSDGNWTLADGPYQGTQPGYARYQVGSGTYEFRAVTP